MKKLLVVFGTRPEAIKLAPLIWELKKRKTIHTLLCCTAQHREMLEPFLRFFHMNVDFDLNLMSPRQTLGGITSRVVVAMERLLRSEKVDWVVVQGDTSTSAASALAAYYCGARLAHVEAGLRTYDKRAPFPEEINRQIIGRIADLHFAPTDGNRRNLLREGIPSASIFVTGNPVIDALQYVRTNYKFFRRVCGTPLKRPYILVTAHRRESFGEPLESLWEALKEIVRKHLEFHIYYPVHLNPAVREKVEARLGEEPRIHLMPPLGYLEFLNLLFFCFAVVSDSGGVQEEASFLGKPLLILREKTERPEVVEGGNAILVGMDRDRIVRETGRLIDNKRHYGRMSRPSALYGDGKSSRVIADLLVQKLA